MWDYYTKTDYHGFLSWSDNVPPLSLPENKTIPPFMHTVRSAAVSHLVSLQIRRGFPVLLNGVGGSGKTALLKEILEACCKPPGMDSNLLHVHCNLLTSAEVIWNQILDCLDWDWGRKYTPKGCKKLICFIDDLHNTEVCTHNNNQGYCTVIIIIIRVA